MLYNGNYFKETYKEKLSVCYHLTLAYEMFIK